ncbi:MAG: A/G-specific adenine glycosylase [Ferruginibacter sp.]
MNAQQKYFTSRLMEWNRVSNNRQMPWKGEKDPYKIWLSEIILQQTRVEQGRAYYERFIKKFPTIQQLAAAPETAVFKLWEGLGYYSRCKNLIATARLITEKYGGRFPAVYEEILALKGVGPYTAAAIASFAFQLPHAVVDGNVFRVLARYFGDDTPADSTAGKKSFTALAGLLLDKKMPGLYNQALMDFGATICKPQAPRCPECPLRRRCRAFAAGTIALLPVKEKKITLRRRWFYYLQVEYNGKVYVRKRSAGDIWENLYEFVLYESSEPLAVTRLQKKAWLRKQLGQVHAAVLNFSPVLRQQLSHQLIEGQIIHLQAMEPPHLPGYEAVTAKQLARLPFPWLLAGWLNPKNSRPGFER